MNEYENEENEQEAAFVESESLTLYGKPLEPFSAMRQAAIQNLGFKLPTIRGEEQEFFYATGMYDGIIKDVMMLCYICSCSKSDVRKAFGTKKEKEFILDEIFDFADKNGMVENSEKMEEAVKLFFKTITKVSNSTGVTKSKDLTKKDSTDPLGNV